MKDQKKIQMLADWHIHTHFSGCSNDPEQNPAAIFRIAKETGLLAVGFADHLWQNPDKRVWPKDLRGVNTEIIDGVRREIAAAGTAEGLKVYVGAETEMTWMGGFCITREFAESLDFVLMPSNHIHQSYVPKPAERTKENYISLLLERFAVCAKSGLVTIMAHPMLPYGAMEFFAPGILERPEQELIDTFGLAAERNVFFEVNRDHVMPEHSAEEAAVVKILQCAKRAGCRFTFGSDAHHPAALFHTVEMEEIAETAGLLQSDFADIEEVARRRV